MTYSWKNHEGMRNPWGMTEVACLTTESTAGWGCVWNSGLPEKQLREAHSDVCYHLLYLLLPHLLRLWHVAYVLPIGIHKWQVIHMVWIWTKALLAYYFSTACTLMKRSTFFTHQQVEFWSRLCTSFQCKGQGIAHISEKNVDAAPCDDPFTGGGLFWLGADLGR
jgi:hypothetical protein